MYCKPNKKKTGLYYTVLYCNHFSKDKLKVHQSENNHALVYRSFLVVTYIKLNLGEMTCLSLMQKQVLLLKQRDD